MFYHTHNILISWQGIEEMLISRLLSVPMLREQHASCLLSVVLAHHGTSDLAAEFRSTKKCTLSVPQGIILSQSFKCTHSATKAVFSGVRHELPGWLWGTPKPHRRFRA